MKPIRVALVHRDDWYRGEARIDGLFSYEVPQFVVKHFPVKKGFTQDLHALRDHDVVFWDDGKYKDYAGFTPEEHTGYVPPVVMYALYPTLTNGHFQRRAARAINHADLILVDHDDMERWTWRNGIHARRLAYATNERYYRDRGLVKDVDVGFYCVYGWNKERPALDRWMAGYCKQRGWSYKSTHGESVGTKYAELLARTKCVVHLNRTLNTRPPRIFDAAASGCCFVGSTMPVVSGECWEAGVNYLGFDWPCSEVYEEWTPGDVPVYTENDCVALAKCLDWALEDGGWRKVAERAKAYVLACHTWERRAVELYGTLLDVFPRLREGREKWMYQ